MHILFVCTGNICRSPTAERLAAAYGLKARLPSFTTSSVGTSAVIDKPIHPEAAAVLQELGGESSNFAARQLTRRVATEADLVLTMARRHRAAVLELAPRQLNKTFLLTEAAQLATQFEPEGVEQLAKYRAHLSPRDYADIPDPIGKDAGVFAEVGSTIQGLLPPILELCRDKPPRKA